MAAFAIDYRPASMLSGSGMFDSRLGSSASAAQTADDFVQPTFPYALRVWWAYYWRTSLISFVIVAVGVFVLAAGVGIFISARAFLLARRILPYAITYLVAFFVIRYVLGKSFRNFRIALLPRDTTSGKQPMPRTFRRTVPVWWAFSWRTFVYSLIVSFVATIPITIVVGILSEFGRAAATLAGFGVAEVIAGAVGMFVFYSNILGEEFGDFRICLLPPQAAAPAVGAISPADGPATDTVTRQP